LQAFPKTIRQGFLGYTLYILTIQSYNQCKVSPIRDLCTTPKVNGKVLQQSEFQKYIEENTSQVLKNPKA